MPASSCPQTRTILVIWESSVSARTLGVIIEIVTPPGMDTRRWRDGLLFAYNAGVAPKNLVAFLKQNGGIAGCARLQQG